MAMAPRRDPMRAMRFMRAIVIALWMNAALAAPPMQEPGVMLREGTWDGGVGTFAVPDPFAALKPSSWPGDGWHRLALRPDRIEIAPVASPDRTMPEFLRAITVQVALANGESGAIPLPSNSADETPLYVRVPGLRLREGSVAIYKFRNGTAALRPMLDHRYELALGDVAFAFSVQNGLRTKSGAPYGDGAQYVIEYGGNRYEYSLEGFGWDSSISAIADIDGDGKPDFLVSVGGSNSANEYLLLSSQARPGRNPPTASLHAFGC